MLTSSRVSAITGAVVAFVMPSPALAYIGPGAGLGAIAITAAFALGVLLLAAGLVWYPLKRFLKARSGEKAGVDAKDKPE